MSSSCARCAYEPIELGAAAELTVADAHLLRVLVVDRVTPQVYCAARDLAVCWRLGLPVHAIHVDVDGTETLTTRARWRAIPDVAGCPLIVLPGDANGQASDVVASYVRGMLSVDASLRVGLITVNRRAATERWRIGTRRKARIAAGLRTAFAGNERVVLTEYSETDNE
jgi:hypothetical protein